MTQRVVLELVIDETNEDSDFTTLQAAITKTIADYGFTLVVDLLMPYDAKSDDLRYGFIETCSSCGFNIESPDDHGALCSTKEVSPP